jgi:parallel beta-helix repeat protein
MILKETETIKCEKRARKRTRKLQSWEITERFIFELRNKRSGERIKLLSKPVSGVMLTWLLIGMMTLSFNVQPVKASGTIYIRADGSVEGTDKIQRDGNTYTFVDDINDSIVVERDNIVIDGAGYALQGTGAYKSKGIDLTSRTNVTIRNIQIINFYYGIYLGSSSNNNTISGNNIIANNYDGVELYSSSNNTISGNSITANFYGVRLYSSSHNTLSKNNVTAITANDFYGIYLYESSNNTLIENNITNNSEVGIWLDCSSYNVLKGNSMAHNTRNFGVDGISSGDFINYVDDSNMVNSKPIYYWISEQDKTIPLDAGCVILVKCERIKVQNLMLGKNMRGIQLINTKNSTIIRNNITNCHDGISLNFYSNYNNITENNIISNRNGLFISYLSKYNVISKNRITGNHNGIIFSESSDNKIYHNNFIDNAEQAYSYASPNVWDDGYPYGGNYWSDYIGTDSNHDGIGDSNYTIDANNNDRYPLMGMFSSFNPSIGCNVDVISNSTIDDFGYFESNDTIVMHVSNMTSNQTFGFVRICIPHALMNETYQVIINGGEPYYVNYTLYDNGTHRWIYFSYQHSTLKVVIIPEFPSFMILPLFMVFTMLAVVFLQRKNPKKKQKNNK